MPGALANSDDAQRARRCVVDEMHHVREATTMNTSNHEGLNNYNS